MSSDVASKVNTTSSLARHLGLSRWTVSRALNGHAGVKSETVARVHAAMDDLGFSPNLLARGLRGGKTGVVGICFQTFGTPVFSARLIALQNALRESGYRAMIELIDDGTGLERQVIRHFQSMKVEGIVFVGGPSTSNLSYVKELVRSGEMSVVSIDPVTENELLQVAVDRAWAMDFLLAKLFDLGHRKIAFFGIQDNILYGSLRLKTLRKTAKRLGLDWEKDIRIVADDAFADMDYASGKGLADKVLREGKFRSTAILALNDQVAIGAFGRFQEEGIRVPRDVSIVGYDNLQVAKHLHPTLASIDQCIEKISEEAVRLLKENIGKKRTKAKQAIMIRPRFVNGESLAKPKR